MSQKRIENLVYKMLTENTGSAMMDSGGAYGRNHEKNSKKTLADFKAEPSVWVDDYQDAKTTEDVTYTISVFHYLTGAGLELDAICDAFNKANGDAADWDCEGDYYGVSAKGEKVLERYGLEKNGESWNTYNHQSSLSQVLQGCYFGEQHDDQRYVLIQIHGGCDVRGGYTNARLFRLGKYSEGYLPIEDVYASIERENEESIRLTNAYNGWSLTSEDDSGMGDGEHPEVKPGDKITAYFMER